MVADGRGTAALLRAFQRHGIQLASSGKTVRGVLRRDWRFVVGRQVRSLALELELVCDYHQDDGQRPLVLFTSATPSLVTEQPVVAVVANRLGERFVTTVMRGRVESELALLEPGERVAQFDRPGTAGRDDIDGLLEALENVSSVSRARAGANGEATTSHVCRILISALIVSRPLMESSRTARGEISMVEQDAVSVMMTLAPAADPVLVHVVRSRAVDTFVARFRAAFDAIRNLRSELERAARRGM
jgi:hypothetical protein